MPNVCSLLFPNVVAPAAQLESGPFIFLTLVMEYASVWIQKLNPNSNWGNILQVYNILQVHLTEICLLNSENGQYHLSDMR